MSLFSRLFAWMRRPRRGRVLGPACPRVLEEARAGRIHVSPSGRLVTLSPPPPALLETCPWCGVDLVGWLETHHWVLTDAGRQYAVLTREAERERAEEADRGR